MANTKLTAKWLKIRDFLRSDAEEYIKDEDECRNFIEAIIWPKCNVRTT